MNMDREDLLILLALALGILLVAVGAGMVYVPAAPISAGALLIAGVVAYLRGAAR